MSQIIGHGYGSEWHLLRFLGYHRKFLNDQIEKQTGLKISNWLDFNFSEKNERHLEDKEFEGLNFLDEKEYSRIEQKWKSFWPTTGRQQNWDAVGKAKDSESDCWVLVEAKAHISECKSNSKASEKGGRNQIIKAMESVIQSNFKTNNTDPEKWLNKYYQYANRLASLHFLIENDINANLLFIYFIGDNNSNEKCPKSAEEWKVIVDDIHKHLGIDEKSSFMRRVKHLYLPVHNEN